MEILNLALSNFRNFSSKKIVFDSKLTVILGKNGSGKSNIQEAIAIVSGIRPTRVETDLDLVKFGQSEAKITALVENDMKTELIVNFVVSDSKLSKSYFIGTFKKHLYDFSELFSVVIYSRSCFCGLSVISSKSCSDLK